jgi:hypothetical protein
MSSAVLPVIVGVLFALWLRKKLLLGTPSTPSIVVFDENRWLCAELTKFGFACTQIDSRQLRQHAAVVLSDDIDALQVIADADFFVLGEASDVLLGVQDEDSWRTDDLEPALAALRSQFGVDIAKQVVLLPGAPPRVGQFDLTPVRSLLEAVAVAKLIAVAPTWCIFPRVVKERNETTFLFMPDHWHLNHHGSFVVAQWIHRHFRLTPETIDTPLPDNMDTATAEYLRRVLDDCVQQVPGTQDKSATTPAWSEQ